LAADIQGDIHAVQNKPQDAIKAYSDAWRQLEDNPEYRRLVTAKLNALGVNPEPQKGTSP
jgi:predicted negative regulator of RcsB-dependent stress response